MSTYNLGNSVITSSSKKKATFLFPKVNFVGQHVIEDDFNVLNSPIITPRNKKTTWPTNPQYLLARPAYTETRKNEIQNIRSAQSNAGAEVSKSIFTVGQTNQMVDYYGIYLISIVIFMAVFAFYIFTYINKSRKARIPNKFLYRSPL